MSFETYVAFWDVFYLLLGLLIEFALFVIVTGVLMRISEKFLERINGVVFSFCVTKWRDRRD